MMPAGTNIQRTSIHINFYNRNKIDTILMMDIAPSRPT